MDNNVKKVICISGERYTNKFYNIMYTHVKEYKEKYNKIEFIFGDCTGVDTSAREICNKLNCVYTVYPALWNIHGLAAGPIRNKQMIDLLNVENDEVWVYHTNLSKSKGTKNVVKLANNKKLILKKY